MKNSNKPIIIFIMVITLNLLVSASIFAQVISEDSLSFVDDRAFLNGILFSGKSYSEDYPGHIGYEFNYDNGFEIERIEYFEDGAIKERTDYKKGIEMSYYENGQIESQLKFHDEMPKEFRLFNEDGTIDREQNYVQDSIYETYMDDDGKYISVYLNTNNKFKRWPEDSDLRVNYTYYLSGQLNIKASRKDGKLNGPYVAYHENGQFKVKAHYLDGKRKGLYINYYENGQIRCKGDYINGKEDGKWDWYLEDGTFDETEIYHNGVCWKSYCDCCNKPIIDDKGWYYYSPNEYAYSSDLNPTNSIINYCSKECAMKCR